VKKLSDPTPLELIVKQLDRIEEKQDETNKCLTNIKVRQEGNYNRSKKNEKAIEEHLKNKDLHYNQGYNETFTERAWRKKGEITVSAILGSITGLLAYLKSIGAI